MSLFEMAVHLRTTPWLLYMLLWGCYLTPATGALTQEQKEDLVDAHNYYRRIEGASNMELMKWNPVLAGMAQVWADTCESGHGQPENYPNAPDEPLGQNLWSQSGGTVTSLTPAVSAWYNEIVHYNYDTLECAENKVCGHYTQVVWSKSNEIGCGYAECGNDFYYLVCNYAPAGNYAGVSPYLKGQACSQCESGSQWCDDGLCVDGCTGVTDSCECNAVCHNCGTVDPATCSCACADGWHGTDCSKVCEDTSNLCGNGWYEFWCVPERDYVLRGCPALCGLCVAKPDGTSQCPTSEAPTTEAPVTEAQTTQAPTTQAATTEAPNTGAPTTEVPVTEAPVTDSPTTDAPVTDAPTTEAPTTEAPNTGAPTTEVTEEPPTEEETCSQWSEWDTSGCSMCGGCGDRTRTRVCGSDVTETDVRFCEPIACRADEMQMIVLKENRKGELVERTINRKCCYDFRRDPPRHRSTPRNCERNHPTIDEEDLACTEWSAWDTSGCSKCGGCGDRTRTRMCDDAVETDRAFCEPVFCSEEDLLMQVMKVNRRGQLVERTVNRKCCYDFRKDPPRHRPNSRNCVKRM